MGFLKKSQAKPLPQPQESKLVEMDDVMEEVADEPTEEEQPEEEVEDVEEYEDEVEEEQPIVQKAVKKIQQSKPVQKEPTDELTEEKLKSYITWFNQRLVAIEERLKSNEAAMFRLMSQ